MFEVLLILALTVFSIYWAIYFYHHHQLSYWSRRGVPSPKGELFWGHLKGIIGREYVNVFQLRDWSKQFPGFFGIKKGVNNSLVINDPDLAHEVLVKKFEYFHSHERHPLEQDPDKNPEFVNIFSSRGLRWKRLRTTSNPIFTMNNLRKIMPTMADSINHLMTHMESITNTPVNVHPLFQELTMDVISRIAFGQKGSNLFNNPYISFAKGIFMSPIDKWHTTLPQMFTFLRTPLMLLSKIFKFGAKSDADVLMKNLYSEILKRKEERAKSPGTKDMTECDFIDLFLEAEVPEQKLASQAGALDKRQLKVAKELTVNEIVGQCFIFLLAGYDTTANTLSLVCYELAKNPAALERLVEEIDDLAFDDPLSYEDIHNMKYLDAVVKEGLRLHPIAGSAVNRLCMETTTLGDNLVIEEGTNISIDVLSINRSEKLWGEHPDKFIPDRWLDSEHRHPAAFLTFGEGPRMCLGKRLALLEEKMTLIQLLKNFKLSRCPETEENLKLRGSHVFYPESVTLKLLPRN